MADKTYKVGSNTYDIPEAEVQTFLSDFPDAVEIESFTVDKDTFDIPITERDSFLKDFPTAQPVKKKEDSETIGTPSQVSSEEQPPLEQPKEKEKRQPLKDLQRTFESSGLKALGGITAAPHHINTSIAKPLLKPLARLLGADSERAEQVVDAALAANAINKPWITLSDKQKPLTKKANEIEKNITQLDGDIWSNLIKGKDGEKDLGVALEQLGRGIIGSIPMLAEVAATAPAGPFAVWSTITATSAAQQYAETEGIGMSDSKRRLNSWAYGGLEALGELASAYIFGLIGKAFKGGLRGTLKPQNARSIAKGIAESVGIESSSEGITQVGQNITAILTGEDPNRSVFAGFWDAVTIGGVGFGFGGGVMQATASMLGRAMATDKEVSEVQENFKQQEVLINQLEQTDVDPVKEALKRNIKFLKVQSDLIMDENYELAGKLTPEQQNQVAELYSVWNQLQDKIDSGQMTEVEAKAMQKTVEGIKGEIKAIKDDLIKRLDEEKKAEKEAKVEEVKEGQKTELDKLKEEETKKLDKVKDVAEGETVNKKKLDEIKETFDTKAEEVKAKTEEEVAKIEKEYTEKEPTMEEAIAEPRDDKVYFRGQTPEGKGKIATGNAEWDNNLFVSKSKESALNYGEVITEFRPKKTAKILEEGTPEFNKAIKFKHKTGESLLDYATKVIKKAKELGYDIVEFKRQGDVGTVVMNKDAVVEATPAKVEEVPTEVKEEPKSILNQETDLLGQEKEEAMVPVKAEKRQQVGDIVTFTDRMGNEQQGNFRGIGQDGKALIDVQQKKDGKKFFTTSLIPVDEVKFPEYYDNETIRAIEYAIENNLYQDWIKEGRMTAEDVRTIIKSAKLEVPQELSPTKQVEEKPTEEEWKALSTVEQTRRIGLDDKLKGDSDFAKLKKIVDDKYSKSQGKGTIYEKEYSFFYLMADYAEAKALQDELAKKYGLEYWQPTVGGRQLVIPEPTKVEEKQGEVVQEEPIKEQPQEPQGVPVEPLSPTEGITAPPKVESVAKEEPQGKGEQKRAGFEKRETAKGTRGSIELREDEIGKVVKGIIDKNPHFYTESHRAGAVEAAKAYIIDNGIDNAYADLVAKTKDLEKLPIRHVARQVLMQYFGGKLVELNKQNDKRGANSIADKIIELEDRTQKEVRIAGTTSAFTMWSFLDPQASVFMAEKLVKEINKQKLGFEDEAAQDFLEKWNEEVPTMVKKLLTENKEFKETIDKLEARIKRLEDKKPTTSRVTKEKAKEIAAKVRSLKSSNWGLTFADPLGAVAILDGALELTAKTIEATGNVIQAVNDGIKYIKATDWYKGLTTDNKKEVEKKYRDKIKGEFDFEAEEYVKGTSWYRRESEGITEPTKEQQAKKEYAKTKKESDERLRDQIYDIIAAHWLVEKEGGAELADKLQEELGLTKSEAKKIADIAISTFEAGAQKVFDKTLAPKLPNKAKKKLAFDKFFGLIKRGVLNDSNYADLFAEKYKLRKGLTPDEKRELLRLGLNAEKLAPMGYFGDLAMNEFMQYMAKLTDMDNWATRQTKLMIAANYARMLSGLTTHWINLSSSGVNIAARPLLTLNNWERWFDAAYAYSTGNKMKARLINPMAELYYMYPSYVAGTKIGFNQAMNIAKHGNIKEASKYMESVGNKRGLNVPALEKSTYGKGKAFIPLGTQKFDVNIFNKMKYSGRALMAEDMQMFNVPFSLALAMAARSKAIREGTTLSEKELRKKIIGEIQGTFLTEKQAVEVALQLEQELNALTEANIEVDAGQIKQRRFEIVRSLLSLEPEVIEEATQSARSEIFTGERGGIFSKLSDVASKLFNMNVVVKVAGLPHVPFTTVVGRIADYSLDGIPGYGNLRAIGASPTGIIARARYFHKTGNWRDFFESPAAIGEFKSAQMGSIGSPAYYQQTNRAYMGMMLMTVGAALFLGDDPEDGSEPRWDITGALSYADMDKKQWHPMGAYTIKIPVPGSKKGIHIRYLNFPLVNFMLGTLGNYKDHVRAGKDDEELPAKLGLALHSMFHSLGMIKDTSLAQGISDFIKLIGNGLSAIGSGDEKEILREEDLIERTPENKALIKSLTDMRDDYLQVPLRYVDPLKSNLIQQIWKGITPEGRLKGTSWQLLYYNLGIQNITNDKRTDIFGQEVKVMPGDQGIAWPRPNDSRWKKIWDYNIDLTDITPHDRKNVDGVNRTFEWDEYIERKAKANQLFKKRFDEYFEKLKPEEIEEKRKTFHIEKPSARKRNELDKELNDIWKKTKEDVDKVVFDWREHYKKEPVIFNKLMERSLVPDFYNERQEVDGRKILVPFDLLEKMNKEAMDAFLVSLKPQEKNDDYWKSGSELEKSINRKWDSAIENPKKRMIDDLQKRYGKTGKAKK